MIDMNVSKVLNQTKVQGNRKVEINQIQDKLNSAKEKQDDEGLLKACKEFEAIFMDIVIKEMQSTITDGGLTEKSYARDVYEDMLNEELSKETTKSEDGIGLAKVLYESMKNR